MILLDTNVLIYATDELAPQHAVSRRVVDSVIEGRLPGMLVPQVLIEFLGATTGPSVRSPLSIEDALEQVSAFRAQIHTVEPPRRAFEELADIMRVKGGAGRRIFDFYLAAQARALGVDTLCTYNLHDFAGIPRLRVQAPPDIDIPDASP